MNRTRMFLWQLACMTLSIPAFSCPSTYPDKQAPEGRKITASNGCFANKLYMMNTTTTEKFVIAKLYIRPASTEEFRRALETLAILTRKEAGCIEYTWYPEPAEEGTFTLIEHYRDQAGLKYHFAQPYLAEFVKKMEGWKSKDLKVYFLSSEPDALKEDK
ncbi:antibiotic biosynthesis monooxygenase [Chitinophaga sp. G-6-1-13]|uniref:Antibiotic biosynthesis monooxygenase n=1 Tax=Chitinophaga fulva TaxID=2728842 RepID=A0A848GHZ6_9BACT|nr:putative quinol monooxygenase [Chitinophaga fulva]NML37836.1 antibiotic biosynthesis monooxygenase [Chitinophaga fulva]